MSRQTEAFSVPSEAGVPGLRRGEEAFRGLPAPLRPPCNQVGWGTMRM
jgi:hypothetical protein